MLHPRVRWVLERLGWMALGALILLIAVISFVVGQQPELQVWHVAKLKEEFSRKSEISTMEEYLALEDRLFEELQRKVYDEAPDETRSDVNRYTRGSRADPTRWERDWNRTFILEPETPRAGALLIHGLSDSPYSMKHIATRLQKAGVLAVGMRMPGHGTAPVGLTNVRWEDMATAVRIGMRYLQERLGDKPRYLIGYSNGGALSVEYALASVEDESLPSVSGVVLLSPMIGVSPAAAYAIWQERIGRWFGFDKLDWTDLSAEYDPFKYGSFAVNAGNQSYRLTTEIAERLSDLKGSEAWKRLPPVLAFQSASDGTVSAPALISTLMEQLHRGGDHELIIFDINRRAEAGKLVDNDPGPELFELLKAGSRPYGLGLIVNDETEPRRTVLLYVDEDDTEPRSTPLDVLWPEDVFSLSHIALPFPPGDPLYGNRSGAPSPGVQLGDAALRGERGVLRIPPGTMLRLRWNPFYDFLEKRLLTFLKLEG
ncbi:MAG: alpha/beta fold hydrolase [Planctomycetota bacterium]